MIKLLRYVRKAKFFNTWVKKYFPYALQAAFQAAYSNGENIVEVESYINQNG